MLMSTWDKWSVLITLVKALLVRMSLWENTIAFSLTLLRNLISFENWRGGGGQKGFVVGALPPPLPPLWLRPWICMAMGKPHITRKCHVLNTCAYLFSVHLRYGTTYSITSYSLVISSEWHSSLVNILNFANCFNYIN